MTSEGIQRMMLSCGLDLNPGILSKPGISEGQLLKRVCLIKKPIGRKAEPIDDRWKETVLIT